MTKPYVSLVRRYKDQPADEVFSHFGYKGDQGESWETPYEKLARMSKVEDWDFHRSQFKRASHTYLLPPLQHRGILPIKVQAYLNHGV